MTFLDRATLDVAVIPRQEGSILQRHGMLWLSLWALPLSFLFSNVAVAEEVRVNHFSMEAGRASHDELTRSGPIQQLGFEPWTADDELQAPALEDHSVLSDFFDLQVLPRGLMYKSYLAGEKEPRFNAIWLNEKGRGLVWETQMGGRIGLLRYGTDDLINPEGWQLDMEGGAQTRIDLQQQSDLEAADFRFGLLSTWRFGPNAFKAGYYHLSSHVGDEFLIRNPTFVRLNYVRDSAIVGWTHDLTPDTQVYGEVAYAAGHEDGALPLELQYGFQYSPLQEVWLRGAPYFAANGHTREDEGWITSINTVAGWQWRGPQTNHLFRVGFQYYTGPALQYSFVGQRETLVGMGMWFDY